MILSTTSQSYTVGFDCINFTSASKTIASAVEEVTHSTNDKPNAKKGAQVSVTKQASALSPIVLKQVSIQMITMVSSSKELWTRTIQWGAHIFFAILPLANVYYWQLQSEKM